MAAFATPEPARITFSESTQRLSRETRADVTLMLPWPIVRAYRRPRPRGVWSACTPDFVIPPDPENAIRAGALAGAPGTAGGTTDIDGLLSVHRYCLTIPAPVRRAVGQFPERHWDLLSWAARTGPAADDLLLSNPALAFAVACGADLCPHESPVRYRDLRFLQAYHSQRDVMAKLGFPATERARRILRKIRPRAVSISGLTRLRPCLDDPEVAERLSHVPQINRGVLAMVEDRTITRVAPAAIEQVAREDSEAEAAAAARRLAEAIRLWGLVRPTVPMPVFNQAERVQEVHAELRRDAARLAQERAAAGEFPPPPVPGTGTIVPIRTTAMLLEEGRLQKNCVADYTKKIAAGKMAVYRVLYPQRCTLSLVPSRGIWTLDQLKAACNRPPDPATTRAVVEWLRNGPVAPCPVSRSRARVRREGQGPPPANDLPLRP